MTVFSLKKTNQYNKILVLNIIDMKENNMKTNNQILRVNDVYNLPDYHKQSQANSIKKTLKYILHKTIVKLVQTL